MAAQYIKLSPPTLVSLEPLVCVLRTPFPIQVSINGLRETIEDGPSVWTPGTHRVDSDGAPGSCFKPGPDTGYCNHLDSEPENVSLRLSNK